MSAALSPVASKPPRIPEGITPLHILAEAAPPSPPPRKAPPQILAWHRSSEEHQFGWRYEYTERESPNYIKRKGLWNYEEIQIDSSNQLGELPKHPAIESSAKKLADELDRLAALFDPLEEHLERAMDDFHNYTEEILDLSEKEDPGEADQLVRIALAHADILTGKLDKIYEKVYGEWEIFHRCSLKFTAHWPLPLPSLGVRQIPNFFGGTPFDLAAHRGQVGALYSTYRTILDIHGIYLSRFLSTVIHTCSLVRQPVPWLKQKATGIRPAAPPLS